MFASLFRPLSRAHVVTRSLISTTVTTSAAAAGWAVTLSQRSGSSTEGEGIDESVVNGGPGVGCRLGRAGASQLPLAERRGGFARCDQARASLDFAGIPYAMVDVNPLLKREVVFTKYTKVPIAVLNGMEVHDSACIVDYLETLIDDTSHDGSRSERLYAPETEETKRWRKWAYARFVHVLSPNIYRTADEAIQSFEFMMDADHSTMSYLEAVAGKWIGALIMWAVGKRLMAKHGFDKEGDGSPRQALYRCLDEWVDAVEEVPGRRFLGGEQPSRADITVFGMLRAIEGLDSFRDALGNTRVGGWYRRMEDAVGESACLHRVSNRGTSGITGVAVADRSAVDRYGPTPDDPGQESGRQ